VYERNRNCHLSFASGRGTAVVCWWRSVGRLLAARRSGPDYQPAQFVVPASWHGASPFVEAQPSDAELRTDWWTLYDDPTLDRLEAQAMAANPDLQAAAERFIEARDMMMKARSQYIPHIGLGFGASDNMQSIDRPFRASGEPNQDTTVAGGIAFWEPDFWSALRNTMRSLRSTPTQSPSISGRSRSSRPSLPSGSRQNLTSPASNLSYSVPRRNWPRCKANAR
jgi:outer membrane protein TolC